MSAYPAIFIDTWGWVALGHRRDAYHQEVRRIYNELRTARTPIHTSDYILDEVSTLLFKREVFPEAVTFVEGIIRGAAMGELRIERVTSERFLATWELRKKLQDKPRISFTDLSSMVIMKELGIQHILTGDDHFLQVGMGFLKVP